jgi:hypothetical protein
LKSVWPFIFLIVFCFFRSTEYTFKVSFIVREGNACFYRSKCIQMCPHIIMDQQFAIGECPLNLSSFFSFLESPFLNLKSQPYLLGATTKQMWVFMRRNVRFCLNPGRKCEEKKKEERLLKRECKMIFLLFDMNYVNLLNDKTTLT